MFGNSPASNDLTPMRHLAGIMATIHGPAKFWTHYLVETDDKYSRHLKCTVMSIFLVSLTEAISCQQKTIPLLKSQLDLNQTNVNLALLSIKHLTKYMYEIAKEFDEVDYEFLTLHRNLVAHGVISGPARGSIKARYFGQNGEIIVGAAGLARHRDLINRSRVRGDLGGIYHRFLEITTSYWNYADSVFNPLVAALVPSLDGNFPMRETPRAGESLLLIEAGTESVDAQTLSDRARDHQRQTEADKAQ